MLSGLVSFKGLGFLWNEQAAHGSTRGLCLSLGDLTGLESRISRLGQVLLRAGRMYSPNLAPIDADYKGFPRCASKRPHGPIAVNACTALSRRDHGQ